MLNDQELQEVMQERLKESRLHNFDRLLNALIDLEKGLYEITPEPGPIYKKYPLKWFKIKTDSGYEYTFPSKVEDISEITLKITTLLKQWLKEDLRGEVNDQYS